MAPESPQLFTPPPGLDRLFPVGVAFTTCVQVTGVVATAHKGGANRTEVLLPLKLATARSALPSPLKSPVTTVKGPAPPATFTGALNVPVPVPSSIERLFEVAFAAAR